MALISKGLGSQMIGRWKTAIGHQRQKQELSHADRIVARDKIQKLCCKDWPMFGIPLVAVELATSAIPNSLKHFR